eukprot:g15378.t1
MLRWLFLSGSHAVALAIGFALGVYLLPILTAPKSPDEAMLRQTAQTALFQATFRRDLKGSDFLHWGEGAVGVDADKIVHVGALSPGPDYKLYLLDEFVEDEAQFLRVKQRAQLIGDVRTFDGFLVPVPAGVDVAAFSTVLVWCEAFGEFITAAKYR